MLNNVPQGSKEGILGLRAVGGSKDSAPVGHSGVYSGRGYGRFGHNKGMSAKGDQI